MNDNYLPFDAFRKRCADQGEKDPARQSQFARNLHALGIIPYYKAFASSACPIMIQRSDAAQSNAQRVLLFCDPSEHKCGE
jgi:hypothetical protein